VPLEYGLRTDLDTGMKNGYDERMMEKLLGRLQPQKGWISSAWGFSFSSLLQAYPGATLGLCCWARGFYWSFFYCM
jgi:hypothetical protein